MYTHIHALEMPIQCPDIPEASEFAWDVWMDENHMSFLLHRLHANDPCPFIQKLLLIDVVSQTRTLANYKEAYDHVKLVFEFKRDKWAKRLLLSFDNLPFYRYDSHSQTPISSSIQEPLKSILECVENKSCTDESITDEMTINTGPPKQTVPAQIDIDPFIALQTQMKEMTRVMLKINKRREVFEKKMNKSIKDQFEFAQSEMIEFIDDLIDKLRAQRDAWKRELIEIKDLKESQVNALNDECIQTQRDWMEIQRRYGDVHISRDMAHETDIPVNELNENEKIYNSKRKLLSEQIHGFKDHAKGVLYATGVIDPTIKWAFNSSIHSFINFSNWGKFQDFRNPYPPKLILKSIDTNYASFSWIPRARGGTEMYVSDESQGNEFQIQFREKSVKDKKNINSNWILSDILFAPLDYFNQKNENTNEDWIGFEIKGDDSLKPNSKYEIRIRSRNDVYSQISMHGFETSNKNGFWGKWSKMISFKTKPILNGNFDDSIILNGYSNLKSSLLSIISQRYVNTNKTNINLIYRASEDGFDAMDFHYAADQFRPTLTIVKSEYGHVFGGWSMNNWQIKSCWRTDIHAWMFLGVAKETILARHGLNSLDLPIVFEIARPLYSTRMKPFYGPVFGRGFDMFIANESNINRQSYAHLGYAYRLNIEMDRNEDRLYDLLGGSLWFKVIDIEIFHVFPKDGQWIDPPPVSEERMALLYKRGGF